MLKSMTIRSTLAAVACAIPFCAHAIADPKQLSIPAGNLIPALEMLEKQAAVELFFQPEQLKASHTAGVSGTYEPEAAIRILLKGTSLQLRKDASGAMMIVPQAGASVQSQTTTEPAPADGGSGNQQPSSPSPAHGPQDGSPPSTGGAISQNGGFDTSALQEVIVTAQKRSERLLDVPVPVTVVNTDALLDNNQLRLQDYFTSIPGFMVAPTSLQTTQLIAIRGLTTGQGAPTVGILIDDVPYGSSTALGGGQGIPDLDPGDLARVEVLRGPQGTLYGANSLGGLANYVTIDPSTAGVSARLQAGGSSVVNGSRLGYNVRGSVNMPVTDSIAVRVSGFDRLDPGWIDNPVQGIDGINEEKAYGGRLAALWRVTDDFTVKLSAMYQKAEDGSVPSVDLQPGLGEFQASYPTNTANSKETQAYTATLTDKVGTVTLTSLTGYNISSFKSQADGSWQYGAILFQPLFGVSTGVLTGNATTHKFSEELRLSTPLGGHVDWLLGSYYTRESTSFFADLNATNGNTPQIVGSVLNSQFPTTYKEVAGFTDLTFKFTDQFNVQVGGRYTSFKQHAIEVDDGIYNLLFFRPPRPNPFTTAPTDLSADSFTYLLTPQYKFSPDLMAYVRLASGYRAGGVNVTNSPGVPEGYGPDKTQNYELGVKGDFLDRKLSVDASLYYIDWKNIQLFLLSPTGAGYFQNGGLAKSQGAELAVQGEPVRGLTLGGWVAWNTAVLTSNLPPTSTVVGMSGDRLPYNDRFSSMLSAQEKFPVAGSVSGFVGADLSYVGQRDGDFVAPGRQRNYLPAYAKLDARVGVQGDAWTANLFVNNATDRRGILNRGRDGGDPPYGVIYIQPRTIGVTVVKKF